MADHRLTPWEDAATIVGSFPVFLAFMTDPLKRLTRRTAKALRDFLRLEAAGGLVLMAAALLALIVANSSWAADYEAFFALPLGFSLPGLALNKPLLLWINDGLMALFFLLVALELKREMLAGELADRSQIILPIVAAAGGMLAPALVFALINSDTPQNLRGWAIPAATDIAFALGVLSLLGKRVPLALKVLLTTVAVVDDLGAIIIIALFYTDTLAIVPLLLAAFMLAGLVGLNRFGVRALLPYLALGLVLWLCVLKSGVHATLAGVALGLCIPMRARSGSIAPHNPLHKLEHWLHPWVAFAIVPLFAFANAGLSLAGMTLGALAAPLPLGIALGLVVGKQLGIFGACALLIRTGLVRMPTGVTYLQLYGLSIVAGIGFTMSLFIGSLAFSDPLVQNEVRLGVLSGSLVSMVLGYLVLLGATRTGARQA
jgi:Na+:H+ antiporter, NhaA family